MKYTILIAAALVASCAQQPTEEEPLYHVEGSFNYQPALKAVPCNPPRSGCVELVPDEKKPTAGRDSTVPASPAAGV